MKCNYIEYKKLTDLLFYGQPLTNEHLNYAIEKIRQYIINGGETKLMDKLGIGLKIVEQQGKIISKRLVWINGKRSGSELKRWEIENIGLFFQSSLSNTTKEKLGRM